MSLSRRTSPAAVAAAALALLAGCSTDDLPLAAVTGDVFYNGRPAEAELIFEPLSGDSQPGGRPSTAYSNASGRFELHYTAERAGAVVGPHRVLIKVLRHDRAEATSLEQATAAVKTARLERTVEPGPNHFRFLLTP